MRGKERGKKMNEREEARLAGFIPTSAVDTAGDGTLDGERLFLIGGTEGKRERAVLALEAKGLGRFGLWIRPGRDVTREVLSDLSCLRSGRRWGTLKGVALS